MRIGIDIQTAINKPTGVGQYVINLVHELARLDGDERFSLFYFDFKRRFKGLGIRNPRFELNPIRFMPGRFYNQLSENLGFPDIRRLAGHCDLYHFPNFIIHPLKRGKAVVTVHDLSFARFPQYAESSNLKRLDKRFQYTLERADAIIAVSKFSKRELTEMYGVEPERIEVIYQGVTVVPAKQIKESLPSNYFIFVGTIEPRKNLGRLLEAWRIVRSRMTGKWKHKLLIAGAEGWGCASIREQAREKGIEDDLITLGYVEKEDLPALYRGAEALVFPSIYEGFGLPPLEAMAQGTPVISSSKASLPEVVGEAAIMFDPYNPDEIADAIIRIAEDRKLRDELISRGKERVKSFSWQKTARETLELYRKLLK